MVFPQHPPTPRLEAYRAPTFAAGWANFGTPYNPAGYAVDSLGVVHLRGVVTKPTAITSGEAIFPLPPGYRPANEELFAAVLNTTTGRIGVTAAGAVFAQTSAVAGSSFSLDGLTFRRHEP